VRRLRVGTGVVVIDLANGTTVESIGIAAKLRGLDAQIANGTPGLREISYASTGNEALVSNGGRSTILLVYPPAAGSDVPAEVLDQLSAAARTAVPGAYGAQHRRERARVRCAASSVALPPSCVDSSPTGDIGHESPTPTAPSR
jgi:hypothetical protein